MQSIGNLSILDDADIAELKDRHKRTDGKMMMLIPRDLVKGILDTLDFRARQEREAEERLQSAIRILDAVEKAMMNYHVTWAVAKGR